MYEMLCGHHPFKLKNKNKFEKYEMIMDENEPILMMHCLSPIAKLLLTGLLAKKVCSILFVIFLARK